MAENKFTVTAEHTIEWDVTNDSTRNSVLTTLTGDVTTGKLTLTAEDELSGLTGDIKNEKSEKPTFEKKIMDINDSTGETSGWQDSADYDIGDKVPFELKATTADNVANYKKYHKVDGLICFLRCL